MECIHERKNTGSAYGARYGEGLSEPGPMHPEDFRAHLAWVTAKRCEEQGMGKIHSEYPAYCRRLG